MLYFLIFSVLSIASITIIDFTSYADFSALSLFPLLLIGWGIKRYSRIEIGLNWGKKGDYALALGYPLFVLGISIGAMGIFDHLQINPLKSSLQRFLFVLLVNFIIMIILGLLTEEGFFRGVLWRMLGEKGYAPRSILFATTAVFTLWHVPVALLEFGEDITVVSTLIFLTNATLLGLNWGLLRLRSGSVLVAAVSHSIWNTLVYFLFGFGDGLSGIFTLPADSFFSPERGILGVILNSIVFLVLYQISKLQVIGKMKTGSEGG